MFQRDRNAQKSKYFLEAAIDHQQQGMEKDYSPFCGQLSAPWNKNKKKKNDFFMRAPE
jgi:hypothetical protein